VEHGMDSLSPKGPATVDEEIVADRLFGVLYAELHRLARRELHRKGRPMGLGATTVLHEAYLKLSGKPGPVFADRARFMAYAASVMRALIIDDVRRRQSLKRGGLFQLTPLATDHAEEVTDAAMLSKIGDALDELAKVEPALAQVIELKFFCGVTFAEIAAMRGVSERTVQRDWEKGRLYLHHAISERPFP
jgi:RNA polymerase sigma factor (TIGR02999 family)